MRLEVIKDGIAHKENFRLQKLLDEFETISESIVEVVLDQNDYRSVAIARSCLYSAICRSKRQNRIKVVKRSDHLYLIKQ